MKAKPGDPEVVKVEATRERYGSSASALEFEVQSSTRYLVHYTNTNIPYDSTCR